MTRAAISLWRRALFCLVFSVGLSHVALAQSASEEQEKEPPALLVADSVFVTADERLIAEGNVEAFQGDIRLRASRVEYDRKSEILRIDGPIRIDQGGTVTVLADSAQMDKGLQDGLLSGARLVLAEQLQLASVQMTRVRGRYTQLDKTAVTSCRICDDEGAPLWQIRARRVIHDELERQLYFEDAHLRVLDVPVFYFPRLRLPDPTLERATGFLIPSIRTTSQLGTGVKVPYFFKLGDHADLKLEPYVSPRTRTMNFRYRHAFQRGRVEFEGGVTNDDLIPNKTRGYLFGEGIYTFAREYDLSFDIEAASDNAYLVDYGLPDIDRLESEVALSRTRRDSFYKTSITHFNSLRDGENESILPTVVADVVYEQRVFPQGVGGELRFNFDAHGHYRSSDLDVVGRDVKRATAEAQWNRNWIFVTGLRAETQLGFAADFFDVEQDSNFPERATRTTPMAAMTLRYPMTRRESSGATHYLEPIMQLAWSNATGDPVPNDESTFVEFDEGNLLAISRFPAPDRRETGLRAAYGVNWSRYSPTGWQASAILGQVVREEIDLNFSDTSGLSGRASDFLLAAQVKLDTGLAVTARTLFDTSVSFSKTELRGDWIGKRSSLAGTYLWLQADPAENRTEEVSEFWLDGGYDLTRQWRANATWRYDIEDTRSTRASLGLKYTNECVEVDVGLSRRFTSSTTVEPTTDFGFTIALRGFSVPGSEKYRRACS
ncbi:MAG: LPS-assembly protein LptD [Paracoccaceae bacterium]